jgi:hypothetical protein
MRLNTKFRELGKIRKYLAEIKPKSATMFKNFGIEVTDAANHLHLEDAILIGDIANFVNNGF